MSIKPIGVANPSFTLDANARDCPPLQFVREFTVNGIEAIAARRDTGQPNPSPDQIVWRAFTELRHRVAAPKLACIDTGTGMTADELDRYINLIASTSKTQGLRDNYGMGAKVAGAARSPAGVTYLSWTGDPESGATCTLVRDNFSEWGLQLDDDTLDAVQAADPALCPPEIRGAGWRGTVVMLHGRHAAEDTTLPPTSELGADWLLKAINLRFYDLPEDIEIRCQRPGERGLRRAHGQKALLDPHTVASDLVRLSDATVYWHILREEDERRRGKDAGRFAATGHRAALHNGELYELRTASAGGYRKLQEFGISFGYKRVVIYVEPDNAEPNTVRSRLVMDNEPEDKELPWERWADEFVEDMPQPLRDLVESAVGKAASHDRRDFLRRLAELAHAMPIPLYKRDPDIGIESASNFTHGGSEHADGRGGAGNGGGANASAGGEGNVVSLFTRQDGAAATKVDSTKIPDIRWAWVRAADGSRVPPVLNDMAATFLPRQSMVQLNEDFRGYEALVTFFKGKYGHLAGAGPLIEAEVKIACQNLVIEFIIGVLRLRSAPYWTPDAEEHALDDRALTGCLMQHATIAGRVDERLARRVRNRKAAA